MSKKKNPTPAAGATLPLAPDPVPAVGAPSPPVGFVVPPKHQRHAGRLPTAQQVRDAPDVARELTTSASYTSDFGTRVPAAAVVAAALLLAKGWSDQLAAAQLWAEYVRVQYDSAWRAALALTHQLQPEFALADRHDPAVATRYPQTKDFFAVRAQAAARGAVTRAKKKKAAQAQVKKSA